MAKISKTAKERLKISKLKTKSTDNDKGSRSKITMHEGTKPLQQNEAAKDQNSMQTDNSDTLGLSGSNSSRKDTKETQYAIETIILEGIQGTALSDDEYESEGEDIEYFVVKNIGWVKAMNQEIVALNRTRTWEITHLPNNRTPVGSKWIFKVKYKANGEVERFKVRLVAKGFN
ncbi:ribonuclease H-like domain-containing protein [Tanacetum coccineum]|uniref:Ribonuclease H-like domain-containing protein n=1 Tax=Tanacetum coccineum TaxID=301880 RepID=A0ABQ4XE03_9ASTR